MWAPWKTALGAFTELKSVPTARAWLKAAPERSALWKLAPLTSAPTKTAPTRLVVEPAKLAPGTLPWAARRALRKEAAVASALRNVAPERWASSKLVCGGEGPSKLMREKSAGNPTKLAPARLM